ncbi:hypothetical protein A4A49_57384, partial [Nicotiana attenuata]
MMASRRILKIFEIGSDSLQFETLISNVWSSSEEKRSEAKSIFNTMKQKAPDLLVLKLVDLLGSSQVIDSCYMCVILLEVSNLKFGVSYLCVEFRIVGAK